MKKLILPIIAIFLGIALARSATAQTVTNFEFDTVNWVLPENYEIAEFEGEQALLIENNASNNIDPYAYLKDYEFTDGIIEFDMFCPQSYAYVGFLFRLNQHNNEDRYELFYFSPFQSNTPQAIHYFPVNNGIAWFQYYMDNIYFSKANIPYNVWMHVKAEVAGPRVIVYIDDEQIMTVNNLGRGLSKGSVGFWIDSTTLKCYYANFKITI